MTRHDDRPTLTRPVTEISANAKKPSVGSIDWLQYSVAWPAERKEWPTRFEDLESVLMSALPPHNALTLTGEQLRGIQGYTDGMAATFGRLFWHTSRPEQRINVLFSGGDMRTAIQSGISYEQMIAFTVQRATGVTRLDFALDVYDPTAYPLDLLEAWKRGDLHTEARQVSQLTSYVKDDQGNVKAAPTVYVGSRASDRQLRVYNKAAEQDIAGHWIRIELTLRHERATLAARAMSSTGIVQTGCALIRAFCTSPLIRWYTLAVDGPAVLLYEVTRKPTATERWILDVCLPSIKRLTTEQVNAGDWTVYDATETVLFAILRDTDRIRSNRRPPGGSAE